MAPPSVLIIGGSGAVGRPLVEEFVKSKEKFGRIGVLSDALKVSKFSELPKQGIEVVVGSFLEAASYKGFDTVICVCGNAAMKLQPGIIDAAIAGGVRHFYPTEFGTDLSYGTRGTLRYFRDKIITREHLRDRAKEFPGFSYTIVLTGAFTDWTASDFNQIDLKKHTARPYGTADALVTVTALADVVKYTVESVLLPWEGNQQRRELRFGAETLTWQALLETLEEVQGVKYDTVYLDPHEAEAKEEEARVKGDVEAEISWCALKLMGTGVGHMRGPFDNERFSFKPETVKETFQRLHGKK
ncbi:NAD(P)-binding protein [Favolaschia claudopus]|uniref:NAD(P)-binding protein n=1 Tax=Favolaschia claudopus TaxID=2862362 RepID=A0AAW0C244_9AGAR